MAQATPTAERAYEHVKDLILDGTYGSGELLSEGQVAAELGISRTPVREAFLQAALRRLPGAVPEARGPRRARLAR